MPTRSPKIAVYLEIGKQRTFAGAIDWPGWCRRAKGEEDALQALVAYAPRYARALERSGVTAPPPPKRATLNVVERLEGNAGTDFGAPSISPSGDQEAFERDTAVRLRPILEASWDAFDQAVDAPGVATLRTGPRGGGRQVDAMVEHVLGAEQAYLSKLGGGYPKRNEADIWDAMRGTRHVLLDTLALLARGEPAPRTPRSGRLWTPRYAVRRSAWHALDHAWEIEDRMPSQGPPENR